MPTFLLTPLLLSLLVGWRGAAAIDSRLRQPQEIGGYTVSRLDRAGAATAELSPLNVTENVVNLRQAETGSSVSAKYVQAMRKAGGLSSASSSSSSSSSGSVVEEALVKRQTNGSAALQSVEGGQVFLADVLVGGQEFSVVIDTGSSDPWLVVSDFQCYDAYDGDPEDQDYCSFGTAYDQTQSSTYQDISDLNFNISYADGEYLTGSMGYETFRMAGITVPGQQFGLVDAAAWYGDGVSSGLVGFAYRTLTSAYAGSDPTADEKGSTVLYNPLFVNMYTSENVSPVFSLAIDRDQSIGGVLAIGGIPDVPHSPYFASTPIQPVGVNVSNGDLVYEFYTIDIDGYANSNSTSTQFNAFNNANPLKTTLVGNGTNVIVDSGTSLVYVDNSVADAVAAAYNPAATWDPSTEYFYVSCSAVAPVFGVGIDDKVFFVNSADMIIQTGADTCVAGVQPDLGGLSILGGTWMKNVVSVFDIGAEQMRFAARQFYSTS